MRFLADENIPSAAVDALGEAGADVEWGELARRSELPDNCGVILFRLLSPPANAGRKLALAVTSRRDWSAHFSVIEDGRIRMRPLRSPPAFGS